MPVSIRIAQEIKRLAHPGSLAPSREMPASIRRRKAFASALRVGYKSQSGIGRLCPDFGGDPSLLSQVFKPM